MTMNNKCVKKYLLFVDTFNVNRKPLGTSIETRKSDQCKHSLQT